MSVQRSTLILLGTITSAASMGGPALGATHGAADDHPGRAFVCPMGDCPETTDDFVICLTQERPDRKRGEELCDRTVPRIDFMPENDSSAGEGTDAWLPHMRGPL